MIPKKIFFFKDSCKKKNRNIFNYEAEIFLLSSLSSMQVDAVDHQTACEGFLHLETKRESLNEAGLTGNYKKQLSVSFVRKFEGKI